jgi:hypothetical protein
MAGSFKHVLNDDNATYRGTSLLENMGDMTEAVEQMSFMLLSIRHRWGGEQIIDGLERDYYECARGERPWPTWFRQGVR